MPIVSVNLSDQAYAIYREWKKDRRGSKVVSFAIITYQLRAEQLAMLEPGDKRTNPAGYALIFDEKGWVLE